MSKISDILFELKESISRDWIKTGSHFKAEEPIPESDGSWYIEFKSKPDKLYIKSKDKLWQGAYIIISEKWKLEGDDKSKCLEKCDSYQYLLCLPSAIFAHRLKNDDEQEDLRFFIRYEDHGISLEKHYPKHHLHVIDKNPKYELLKKIEVNKFLDWVEKELLIRSDMLNLIQKI